MFQPWNEAEYAPLLWPAQIGLEADEVIEIARQVIASQLDDGVGSLAGARVTQAHRTHGAKRQRLPPAPRQRFQWQAALEEAWVFTLEISQLDGLGGEQGVNEALIFIAVQGAIEIIAAGIDATSVAVGEKSNVHIYAFARDDG